MVTLLVRSASVGAVLSSTAIPETSAAPESSLLPQDRTKRGYTLSVLQTLPHVADSWYRSDIALPPQALYKYHTNPYRAVNFKRDTEGNLLCPNDRKFVFKYNKHVKGNKYGRTEEIYECENCEGCPHKSECCKSAKGYKQLDFDSQI